MTIKAEPRHLFLLDAVTGTSASFLSGRVSLIREVANRVSGADTSCVLFGERGVGKTTVAWQVASVLEGTNRRFEKSDILRFGAHEKFEVVFHKCSAEVTSVSDLLFNIVTDTSLGHSFASKFRNFLTSDRLSKWSHKFKINLFPAFSYEGGVESQVKGYPTTTSRLDQLKSEEQIKREIFETVVRDLTQGFLSSPRLVIFVDELERAKGRISRLGEYIKDNDEIQFVFLGIANNISDILSDHQSAGRKLNGGAFRVPLLDDNETLWIFENAEEIAAGRVHFDADFRKLAVHYCGGMPWIAQHVGFNSVFQKMLDSSESAVSTLELGAQDFHAGVKKTIEIYEHEVGTQLDWTAIERTQQTGAKVLEAVWSRSDGASEDEIYGSVDNPRMNRYILPVLGELQQASLIKKVGAKYYFFDPVIRIFVRHHLDDAS